MYGAPNAMVERPDSDTNEDDWSDVMMFVAVSSSMKSGLRSVKLS